MCVCVCVCVCVVVVVHWHCSAQLSMFNMEKRYRNKIIIIIIIINTILFFRVNACLFIGMCDFFLWISNFWPPVFRPRKKIRPII